MPSTLYCHPCSQKGVQSAADKYCTDCDESLCTECLIAHNSFKAFITHSLVGRNLAHSSNFEIQKSCSKHENMELDFFCVDHDCLCCRLCITDSHRGCKKFVQLDEAAQGVKRSAIFEDIHSTLLNIKKTLENMLATSENNIKSLADDEISVLTEFTAVKAEILKKLNEAENELKLQIQSSVQQYRSKIEADKASIFKMANCIDDLSEQINFASEHGTDSQIFVLINSCKLEILHHETKIQEIIPKLDTTRMSFSCDSFDVSRLSAKGIVKVASSPCNVKYTGTKMNQAQVLPAPNQSPTKFILDRQFDIKSTGSVSITSIALTGDNRLLLCNTTSKGLLVYSDRGEHLQDCTLAGYPCDSAILGEDNAVVFLKDLDQIQFIDTKLMKAGSTRSVPGVYSGDGITVVNDKICVGGNGKMYILDKTGRYENTITVRGVNLIYYLHPGPRNSVYFTAFVENTAGCVNLTGELLFTYTNDNFEGPEAITTDKGGNIYIACLKSNNIHRLASDGTSADVILMENNGIDRPFGLAFSKDYRKLFVSNNGGKKISIFTWK